MKKVFYLFILATACVACAKFNSAQNADANAEGQVSNAEETSVYEQVEIVPEFPGGISELMNYLQTNIHYPALAMDSLWEGQTVCEFIVEKDGSIKQATVLQSSGYQILDVEALRVILSMPHWTPGRLTEGGDSVRVKFSLPISFQLK